MKDNPIFPPCESASTPLQAQTNPPHRILVVEDDADIRKLNTKMLLHSGYAVDAAEDGAAGWEAFNADSYDLLITDNDMPKLSGVELLKKLRDARMALPVIMATGTLPQDEFTRHPWIQPAATLLKPYTGAEMLRMVKKVLREAVSTADAPHQRPTNPPHRILVVDDDPYICHLSAEVLIRHGYEVSGVFDGEAGWKELRTNNYKLLITEHALPKITGVELVRALRAARMALPVVMLARKLPTRELARNPSLRPAATLLKPFAVEVLLDTVRSVLRATDSPREQIQPLPNWRSQPSAGGLRL